MLANQPVQVQAAPLWLTISALLTEAPATIEDDRALVQAARADLRAFNGLYERHVTRVYRYLLVRVGNVADEAAIRQSIAVDGRSRDAPRSVVRYSRLRS